MVSTIVPYPKEDDPLQIFMTHFYDKFEYCPS